MPITVVELDLDPIEKLRRDIKNAAKTLGEDQARYIVDNYYLLQGARIRAENQQRASLAPNAEPHETVAWMFDQIKRLERQMVIVLDSYSDSKLIGRWAKSICGIGPVLSAGLIAQIDITRALYAGQIWSYAGLNPGVTWEKGQKRPWNPSLKTLCFKIGESFVKVSGNPNDFYGQFYKKRKALENERNDRLQFADQAKAKLEKFKIGKDTKAREYYEAGKLPPAHIHARARRIAVKLFLSHYHEMAYFFHYDKKPPVPYAIKVLEHEEYIPPPNQHIE